MEEKETMEGDSNLKALLKVTTWLVVSMTYARLASTSIQPGKFRLIALLPSLVLLPFLPWYFTSIQLRSISAFFLVWLSTFKLLLLSFGLGPLSPSLPLPTFVAISSLPLKLRSVDSPPPSFSLLFPTILKALVLYLLIPIYNYKSQFHYYLLLAIYCFHSYLTIDIVLALAAYLASIVLGLEFEPQFKAPFKSDSLQDFWGRRWNLMVTSILRPSVYLPVRDRWGTVTAVMATFLVSGLMHEIVMYYYILSWPSGEITCFFILHAVCTVAEGKARKEGWWRPRRAVAVPMVLGFVVATALWLFFPPITRSGQDALAVKECLSMVMYLEDAGRSAAGRLGAIW